MDYKLGTYVQLNRLVTYILFRKSTCKDDWRNISKKLFIESNQ